MSKRKSSYALFKNQDGNHTCVIHSLCSVDENGNPIPFCDKLENSEKEACKNLKVDNFQGCFYNSHCDKKQSLNIVTTRSPINKRNACIIS